MCSYLIYIIIITTMGSSLVVLWNKLVSDFHSLAREGYIRLVLLPVPSYMVGSLTCDVCSSCRTLCTELYFLKHVPEHTGKIVKTWSTTITRKTHFNSQEVQPAWLCHLLDLSDNKRWKDSAAPLSQLRDLRKHWQAHQRGLWACNSKRLKGKIYWDSFKLQNNIK